MPYTAAEVAQKLGGVVLGNPEELLSGFAPAGNAKAGDLTFAENSTYFNRAEQSPASAILVDGIFQSSKKTLIKVSNARLAFAQVLPLFFPDREFPSEVHASSVIDPTAVVDPSAYIGPFSVIGERVKIGPGCVLEGGNHIEACCVLGEGVHLMPRVVLYARTQLGDRVRIHAGSVIGADGFGYVLDGGEHRKVPQIGQVIVQDDVEIGANVTIDRGALGPTVIGKGSKIDNLVQIAHNVSIGEHCLIVAQAGIAGSTKLGDYVILAGQVGLAGHLKIGNRVTVAAQSGVMHDINDGEKWFGTPARPDRQMKRQLLASHQLPDMLRRIAELERALAASLPPPSMLRQPENGGGQVQPGRDGDPVPKDLQKS